MLSIPSSNTANRISETIKAASVFSEKPIRCVKRPAQI
ncbi:hypothetical protein BAA13334_I01840 [Brucella abortus A13334]|nr:hypothetical protein BAA13334_I01840 [Brucella abortus A13334]